MADRNVRQAQEARDELRRAVGFSTADEIDKLESLKKSGIITNEEYLRYVQSWCNISTCNKRRVSPDCD
jgi:hypothetical protein